VSPRVWYVRVPGAGNLGPQDAYKSVKPRPPVPTSPELRRNLKRQIVLALAVLPAAAGLVMWWLPRQGAAAALLRGYAAVAAAIVVGWVLTLGLRRLLWRVGRRLAFSYVLIGVVPIPLMALLALVAAYVMNGFFLGHLYRDALSSTATELRLAVETRFEQLSRGWTSPDPTPVPVSYAYYRDGRKLGGDPRAPRRWQDWWVAGTFETPVPSPLGPQFVALADGRPTLMAAVSQALGANRAEFFLNSVHPGSIAVTQPSPTYLSIDRSRAGNEIRLEAYSYPWPDGGLGWRDLWDNARGDLVPFPEDFRAIFPNGWADVAEREGFELPKGPPKD